MAASGLIIVDKPAAWTSHDVVAKVRKLAHTKRVGHAGTLDPMATGVLVLGVEKATRLLGYLALTEKEYTATIRLGQATDSDDADGKIIGHVPVMGMDAGEMLAAMAALTGEIRQVPPGVSAIKVSGQRAYKLARAGDVPELAARTVTVSEFTLAAVRPAGEVLDIDVHVTCSSGTYIRALARDLGAALGVGGHLTALRRTRVGPYLASQARTVHELAASADARDGLDLIPLADAAAAAFPRRDLTLAEARALARGVRIEATGTGQAAVAAFSPSGSLVALLADTDDAARSLVVFASELAGDPVGGS